MTGNATDETVDNLTNYTNLPLMSSSTRKLPPLTQRKRKSGDYTHVSLNDGEPHAPMRRMTFVRALLKKSKEARLAGAHPPRGAYDLTAESKKRLEAIKRGRMMMEHDLQTAGGTLSTQEAADHLGISAQAVLKQRQAGKLLAVTDAQGHFRFPAFQFTRPQVRQHLQEVLRQLDEESPFVKLNWLMNLDARLGAAPVDLLDRGEVEPVLRAADAFGRHVPD